MDAIQTLPSRRQEAAVGLSFALRHLLTQKSNHFFVDVVGSLPANCLRMVASLRVEGESDDAFRERAERMARYAKILIDSALANHCIQRFIADPELPYTEEGERRSPTVRIEYEEAFAIGGIGECLQATRNKSWGDGPYIHPLRPDDPVDPTRILYVFKEGSRYNLRFEQRRRMKQLLGRKYRPLVQRAKQSTLSIFLDDLKAEHAYAIRQLLRIDSRTFWQACKGRRFIELPDRARRITGIEASQLSKKPKQMLLRFDESVIREDVESKHREGS